ncbi:MAG: hypothetical protein JWQ89_1086 [Devosia sp.]|nr:hypothetical protein [Devosia sp.]
MSLLGRLQDHSERMGEVEAISSAEHSALTYRELQGRVAAGAAFLKSQGIAAGTAIGIAVTDEVEHLTATLALMAVGAHQVTLASHDTAGAKERIARRLELTHILEAPATEDLPGLVRVSWPQRGVAPTVNVIEWTEGGGIIYFGTSGTTGEMKLLPLTDRQIAAQAQRHHDYAGERVLRLGSIEHNISKRLRLYCVWAGGTNVFVPDGEFDVADLCVHQRVTELDISRLHAADLAARELSMLRGVRISVAGSPLPFDVRRSIERNVTPLLTVRYGATECGTIAFAGPGEHDEAEAVGPPVRGLELQIVDPAGAPLPPGTTGLIRLRVDGMTSGYVGDPQETQARFRDGWFYPGDVGMVRADGNLIVQGRSDDMMILNGINVFPAEIERVLERHPAVLASAALPLESKVHGQIPVAAVELRSGVAVTTGELLSYARELLALRAPRRILVLEALPRNSQGKILRREIAAQFETARSGR